MSVSMHQGRNVWNFGEEWNQRRRDDRTAAFREKALGYEAYQGLNPAFKEKMPFDKWWGGEGGEMFGYKQDKTLFDLLGIGSKFQDGGAIPGNETGDKNLIRAEDGEFILNRNAVKGLGENFLNFINDEMFPRFQRGGKYELKNEIDEKRKGYQEGGVYRDGPWAPEEDFYSNKGDWTSKDDMRFLNDQETIDAHKTARDHINNIDNLIGQKLVDQRKIELEAERLWPDHEGMAAFGAGVLDFFSWGQPFTEGKYSQKHKRDKFIEDYGKSHLVNAISAPSPYGADIHGYDPTFYDRRNKALGLDGNRSKAFLKSNTELKEEYDKFRAMDFVRQMMEDEDYYNK